MNSYIIKRFQSFCLINFPTKTSFITRYEIREVMEKEGCRQGNIDDLHLFLTNNLGGGEWQIFATGTVERDAADNFRVATLWRARSRYHGATEDEIASYPCGRCDNDDESPMCFNTGSDQYFLGVSK